tara:strand:- start:85 stop:1611 length:1527 start_codon:yes stop_codon:yes gene_type:complete
MIDISFWDKRNIWTDQAGEMVVREGMQHTINAYDIGFSEIFGGFSVENPRTSDQLHYIMGADDNKDSYIIMCNEEYRILTKKFIGKRLRPSGPFQGGVLSNGQLLMGAPGMPMFWGYVGNGFKIAQRTNSALDVDFTTQSINDGLVVSWQNRIVLGVRDALYFSDLGSPRAFLAGNTVSAPGFIYYLKVSQAGMLIMGTTEGVYQIAADTAYSGEIVQPTFQKISRYPINGFFKCASTTKGPVALSKDGIVSVGSYEAAELDLGDQRIPRTVASPIHFEDYKAGKIFAGREGPIISMAAEQDFDNATYFMLRIDEARQLYSWCEAADQDGMKQSVDIKGILQDSDGTEYMLTNDGIFKFYGNVDTVGDDPIGRFVVGSVSGSVPADPQMNPVVRSITTVSDNVGTLQIASIQGVQKSASPHKKTAAIPVCDVTEWYPAVDPANLKYYTRRLQSVRHLFSVRTNDLGMEVAVEGSGFRIGLVSFTSKGPGQFRPQDGTQLDPPDLEFNP